MRTLQSCQWFQIKKFTNGTSLWYDISFYSKYIRFRNTDLKWPDNGLDNSQLYRSCTYISTHYNDVIMGVITSQITSLTIVYSDANQRKHQSSASLAFVRGIHRGPVNSPHKWPVTRKMFPFDDVIMYTQHLMTSSIPVVECFAVVYMDRNCSIESPMYMLQTTTEYNVLTNMCHTYLTLKIWYHSIENKTMIYSQYTYFPYSVSCDQFPSFCWLLNQYSQRQLNWTQQNSTDQKTL